MRKFLKENFTVYALIRQGANCSLLPTDPKLILFPIDYSSELTIHQSLLAIKRKVGAIDYVLHNAGVTVSHRRSDYFNINSTLTKNMIEAVTATRILDRFGKFIYLSSFAAQGPVGQNGAVSDYGRSKKIAEESIAQSRLVHLIVRPTAIYGEGDKAFLPLFKMAASGIYPRLTPKNQKLTFIYAEDLATAIYEYRDQNGIVHFSDGAVYSHDEVKEAYEAVTGRKLRKLIISPFLVRTGLWFADLFYSAFNIRPEMTLEKYGELSHNWNLNEDPALQQAEIPNPISLIEGFRNTFAYYKEQHLIK